MSNLYLPSFSLKPLPLVLSLHTLVKSLCLSFLESSFIYWKAAVRSSWSLLQAEQPQLYHQPFLIGEVFQPSDNFCGPPLDPFQQVHVFLVLRAPELDIGLQVGSW